MAITKALAVRRRSTTVPIAMIERRIYFIRRQKVMLDTDLAELYGVPTYRLNEQVKRNRKRFPDDFMFQLKPSAAKSLTSQIAMSNAGRGGRRTMPYVFTEQGVAILSSVLNSEKAVQVNIAIMRAFVNLREAIASHKELAHKVSELERRFQQHDSQIEEVFDAIRQLLEPKPVPPGRRIGF
jgi:ORF6N domain